MTFTRFIILYCSYIACNNKLFILIFRHFDSSAVVEDDFTEDAKENECSNDAGEQYFCELCQVYFTSANALRQHVSEHFLNGGIEGQMPLQKEDYHGISTDSRSSTNSSESSSTSENES